MISYIPPGNHSLVTIWASSQGQVDPHVLFLSRWWSEDISGGLAHGGWAYKRVCSTDI